MSLMVHKMLDAIQGKGGRHKFHAAPGTRDQEVELLLRAARTAECFDFGTLVLEPNPHPDPSYQFTPVEAEALWNEWKQAPDEQTVSRMAVDRCLVPDTTARNKGHSFFLPDITQDERQFWVAGLIPLPAPVCWYEFQIPEGLSRGGLLVARQPGDHQTAVMRVDRMPDESFGFDGVLLGLDDATLVNESSQLSAVGNQLIIKAIRKAGGSRSMFGSSAMLAVYLTLMLNSRTTEVENVITPSKLVRAQMRRRETPLPNHRVVTIVPQRFREERAPGGGTHRSPRLHWRRSHLRHFDGPTANAKWKADESHNGKLGWWVTVIPRFLVSRAEVGTVSHEYKVETTPLRRHAS